MSGTISGWEKRRRKEQRAARERIAVLDRPDPPPAFGTPREARTEADRLASIEGRDCAWWRVPSDVSRTVTLWEAGFDPPVWAYPHWRRPC